MIPVVDLALSMKYALGDMQGVNISDYELIEPINQAASMLYGYLSQRYVQAVLKRQTLTLDEEKEYELPSDFVRVHQVYGEDGILVPTSTMPPARGAYRIVGSIFYAEEGTYSFEYYYVPSRVRSFDDELDMPESMRPYMEQLSLAQYRKDAERAKLVLQECESVLAGRQISHFENTGPAQVLGGRV